MFRLAWVPRILRILYVNYNMFRQMFMATIRQCLHKQEVYPVKASHLQAVGSIICIKIYYSV